MVFKTFYLKDTKGMEETNNPFFIISKWRTSIPYFNNHKLQKSFPKAFVLPEKPPNSVKINLKFNNTNICVLRDIVCSLKKNKHFWEKNLSYDFSCILNEETLTVTITLSCKLWYENKINTLLEKPLGLGISQGEEKPKILFFSTIEVDVDFHKISYIRGSYNALKLTDSRELFSSINQYFSSLIISQLEFKFPIVFSSLVRKRISSQEALLAPISYSLTGTSHLIPIIIEMISKDKTATTCVSLLLPKTKHIEYPMNII